jgi:hypothetical protein
MERLNNFFVAAGTDERLTAMHILFYLSLFACWAQNQFQNPVFISRKKIMNMTKIYSVATYHKYMKELHAFGYIRYEPSYKPKNGTKVWVLGLD